MAKRGRPTHPQHRERLAYARAQAQARFRGEPWQFTWDTWWQLWEPWWQWRGMGADDYCMIREDHSEPWSPRNCWVVPRREYLSPRGRFWRCGQLTKA